MTTLAQTPHDLMNGAGPLVCAVIWFVALADRKAWMRASLVASVFIAIMFRRMSQSLLNAGEVHQALSDMAGNDMLFGIDVLWVLAGLLMLKPLPTEVRRPDARHGLSLGSAMAYGAAWLGVGRRAARHREGAALVGQRLADAEPGATAAGCDRGAADQADQGVVRRGDQVEGSGDRVPSRKVAAAAIAATAVVIASMGGYIVHLRVTAPPANDRSADYWRDMARDSGELMVKAVKMAAESGN